MHAVVLPQILGCYLMGYFEANKDWLYQKYPHLYLGLTTGLCGSITSFSSFALATYLSFAGANKAWEPGADFFNGISVIVLVMGLSFASYVAGKHLKSVWFLDPERYLPCENVYYSLQRTQVSLVGLAIIYIASILILVLTDEKTSSLSVMIAPLGTFARYLLGTFNKMHRIPLGTLTANLIATVIIMAVYISQTTPTSLVLCIFLSSLVVGFCGCLSTISTWISELHKLDLHDAYLYFTGTMTISQLVGLVILGSFSWSGRSLNPVLCHR
ncbi:hypothetical protein EDD86DRAFT_203242 [Gorgonomyces haynaldii]|nr:hypothetical protein EDD86DRAFT_203242 [Gorgonomyces haynaldii]